MKVSFLFLSLIFAQACFSISFEEWKKNHQDEYAQYQEGIQKEYEEYKKAYEKSIKEYKEEISQKWPTQEISTKHKFVQYDKDYSTKKIVDFENNNVNVEVIAKSEKEAREKFQKILEDLTQENVEDAYKKDQLETKINAELKQETKIKSQDKIIGDVLTQKQKKEIVQKAQTTNIDKKSYKENTIYAINVKLPQETTIKKAQKFKHLVDAYSNKNNINKEIVYAIMYSESSFNPMARSHIPAYGLMQIVPTSAGVDSYKFIYGKKVIPSADFLYDSNNNVELGVAYLHILYYRYLKSIKDPLSRLYCSIAAYNTGAGNVARSFVGTTNISKASQIINTMTAQQVYNHLMSKLPYEETQKYLKKVNEQRFVYLKLLKNDTL